MRARAIGLVVGTADGVEGPVPVVAFDAPGHGTVRFTHDVSWLKVREVGDTVPVRYMRRQPSRARIASASAAAMHVLVFALAVAGLFLLADAIAPGSAQRPLSLSPRGTWVDSSLGRKPVPQRRRLVPRPRSTGERSTGRCCRGRRYRFMARGEGSAAPACAGGSAAERGERGGQYRVEPVEGLDHGEVADVLSRGRRRSAAGVRRTSPRPARARRRRR